ncbi:MAG: SDR family oxidoreductase [Caldisericaceae bacterium]|nr:SDR family oxidoreductase [Caldisericaceae bacterium]
MDLENKVVLITGGAVRLGRAITLELSKRKALICCHYHSSTTEAKQLKQQIDEAGGHILLFRQDLSSVPQAENLAERVLSQTGRVDVLVNNAAIFFKTPFGQVSEADWDRLMEVNLKSVFFLSQKIGLQMKVRGAGKIVNIADSGALHPFPSYLPYSISKAGIVTLTIGLAKALAPEVQVNCINPGPVMMPPNFLEAEKQFAINQTLLKREGNAEDIARTVRFLIEDSDYITGSCINVDGGRAVR